MTAQVIPFDPSAPRRYPSSVERAWSDFHEAQQHALALMQDPDSNSRDRLDASVRAIRLHQAFVLAAEAM